MAMMPPMPLDLWTIYERPTDYPLLFVARRWQVGRGYTRATCDVLYADSLEEIRAKLPRGLLRIERYRFDEPQIVEVWV